MSGFEDREQGYVVGQLDGRDNYGLCKKDITRIIDRFTNSPGSRLALSVPVSASVAHRSTYLRNVCTLIKAHRGPFYVWTPFNPRTCHLSEMEWLIQSFGVYSTQSSKWDQTVWFLTTNDQGTGIRFKSYTSEKQVESHSRTFLSFTNFFLETNARPLAELRLSQLGQGS